MSQIKISQLPYVGNTGYTATDIIPFVSYIVPTGTTSETKIDDLKDYVLENSFFLPLSGGTVTGDTIFTSGLTATTISATTYQNLPIDPDTYVTGYTYNDNVFTINQNNGQPDLTATIDSVTGLTVNGDLTVTGDTSLQGLTATTISATTYQNLPIDPDTYVTGFTYSANTFTISDNSGSTFNSTFNDVTGLTINGNLTVTGDTSLQGLTATTISATTYQNLPIDPDTYVTGFTYGSNVFTIKQNNGQSDLTSVINSVTGWTVNGGLTVTGNTSINAVTATTINSGTVTVTNTSGTPSQAASFDSTGKLVAGLGQTTFTAFGSATLSVTSAVTTFTVLPGVTQTITVPENCKLLITANGGMNTTSTTTTSIAVVDIAIFIDGAYPTNGGYIKIGAHNPSSTAVNNTGLPWSITTIQNLSAGSHTIDVRAVYSNGSTSSVSGNNTTARQGGLYITIIKN